MSVIKSKILSRIIVFGCVFISWADFDPGLAQSISGDCNIVGNELKTGSAINIYCTGIRPQALENLQKELGRLKLSVDESLAVANRQAARYKAYEQLLSKVPQASPELEAAWRELDKFNLSEVEIKLKILGIAAISENATHQMLDRAMQVHASGDIGQIDALQRLISAKRDFSGRDLSGIYLSKGHFMGGIFNKAQLKAVDLTEALLDRSDLSDASLSWSTLNAAQFSNSRMARSFAGFVLAARADFREIDGRDTTWFGADLRDADFSDADLRSADFQFSDLRGAKFDRAKLETAFFVGSNLTGASFLQATFKNTNFTASSIRSSQLSEEQQKEICRTPPHDRGAMTGMFNIILTSVSPSSHFPSGKAFQAVHQDWVQYPSRTDALPECPRRTIYPANNQPIYSGPNRDVLQEEMSFHLPEDLLSTAHRRREFIRRIAAHLKGIREIMEKGGFVKE